MKTLINAEEKNLLRSKLFKIHTLISTNHCIHRELRKEALFTAEYQKVKLLYGKEKANKLLEKYKKEAYSRPDVINSAYIISKLHEAQINQE